MKKITLIALTLAAFILPKLSFAEDVTIETLGEKIIKIINGTIIPIIISVAVIIFIIGVIKYITAKDEEKQGEARKLMISGIIGLFVIFSIWGLVAILKNTFDLDNDPEGLGTPCFVVDDFGNCLD